MTTIRPTVPQQSCCPEVGNNYGTTAVLECRLIKTTTQLLCRRPRTDTVDAQTITAQAIIVDSQLQCQWPASFTAVIYQRPMSHSVDRRRPIIRLCNNLRYRPSTMEIREFAMRSSWERIGLHPWNWSHLFYTGTVNLACAVKLVVFKIDTQRVVISRTRVVRETTSSFNTEATIVVDIIIRSASMYTAHGL